MGGIRMGASACLVGEKVRYDGRHKRNDAVMEIFSKEFELVPVCPEFELGLGVPREPMHLEGDPENPRLVTTKTRKDLTVPMQAWCRKRVKELEKENLCGFIFKSKSPSCGTETANGSGLFARIFMDCFPTLPMAEERMLHDAGFLERFFERVRRFFEQGPAGPSR